MQTVSMKRYSVEHLQVAPCSYTSTSPAFHVVFECHLDIYFVVTSRELTYEQIIFRFKDQELNACTQETQIMRCILKCQNWIPEIRNKTQMIHMRAHSYSFSFSLSLSHTHTFSLTHTSYCQEDGERKRKW